MGLMAFHPDDADIAGKALAAAQPLCDSVVVLPNTGPVDDAMFTKRLYDLADKSADWFYILDADELLVDAQAVRREIESLPPETNTYRLTIDWCLECNPMLIYLTRREWLRAWRSVGNLDFSVLRPLHKVKCPIPEPLQKAYVSEQRILHCQARSPKQVTAKYKRYIEADPNKKYQATGYEHLRFLGKALETRDFSRLEFL